MKFADVEGQRMSAFPSGRGTCRACKGETHAKCGEFVQWHWAHKRGSPCGDTWWENESPWHRAWKNRFPEDWQEVPVFDQNNTACHIADVKTPAGLVIEFQRSTIHPDERKTREAFYKPMLWVVDGTRNEFDSINFRNFRGRIDPESAIAGFHWYGRSKLFRRWHTQLPVFIDFGEHGFWRILRFDPEGRRGIAGLVDIPSFVALACSGTTDFQTAGGPAAPIAGNE